MRVLRFPLTTHGHGIPISPNQFYVDPARFSVDRARMIDALNREGWR